MSSGQSFSSPTLTRQVNGNVTVILWTFWFETNLSIKTGQILMQLAITSTMWQRRKAGVGAARLNPSLEI